MWDAEDITDEIMERAEREAMKRPSSASFDEPLYVTHAPTLAWAERGDDILDESNYLMGLDLIEAAATEGTEETTSEDVIDANIRHWLVGSLRQIFVRVRTEDGAFTSAWREACRIAMTLRDYPILDEEDFSEREYAEYERQIDDAMNDAKRAYADFEQSEVPAIAEAAYTLIREGAEDYCHGDSGSDADYEAVERVYRLARDTYFTKQAEEWGWLPEWAPLPGQLELFATA